jgi:hypothetical protein
VVAKFEIQFAIYLVAGCACCMRFVAIISSKTGVKLRQNGFNNTSSIAPLGH